MKERSPPLPSPSSPPLLPPFPFLLSSLPSLTPSYTLSLHQYLSLSPSSALNSHWCFFSSVVSIASWEGGEVGWKQRRERWCYLLINLSWSRPPINQTDKRHWMAERCRQTVEEGRGSSLHTRTHTWKHTYAKGVAQLDIHGNIWEFMHANMLMKCKPALWQCGSVFCFP